MTAGAHRATPVHHHGHRRERWQDRWFAPDWAAEHYPWFLWPILALLTGFILSVLFFVVINGDYSDDRIDLPNQPPTGSSHP